MCKVLLSTLLATFVFIACDDSHREILNNSSKRIDTLLKEESFVLLFLYSNPTDWEQARPEFEKVAKFVDKDIITDLLHLAWTDDVARGKQYGVTKYPSLIFFRNGYPILYGGDGLTSEDLLEWIEHNTEMFTKTLTDETFEHLTQASTGATTGDWFIMFYKPTCTQYTGMWEAVASTLNRRMNIAKVDISFNTQIQTRFNIADCPSFIFFHLGSMYRYSASRRDINSFVTFAERWYKNEKAEKLLPPQTPFDALVEKVADSLKEHMRGISFNLIIVMASLIVVVSVLVWMKTLRKAAPTKRE